MVSILHKCVVRECTAIGTRCGGTLCRIHYNQECTSENNVTPQQRRENAVRVAEAYAAGQATRRDFPDFSNWVEFAGEEDEDSVGLDVTDYRDRFGPPEGEE